MSVFINWRMAVVRDKSLSFHAKALGLYLNTYMNDRHDMAYPSISTICSEMAITDKTAIKYLGELEEKGYLTRVKRFGKSIVYYAHLPSIGSGPVLDEIRDSIGRGPVPVSDDVRWNSPMNSPMNSPDAQEKVSKKQNPKDEGFDEFWSRYPKKVAKVAAQKAWRSLSAADRDGALADHLVGRYGDTKSQFIPYPATYLNQRRWTDPLHADMVDDSYNPMDVYKYGEVL